MLVAGVDSSTQSTKVLLCQGEDGTIVARGSAPHPVGTECDPAGWWSALEEAGKGLLDRGGPRWWAEQTGSVPSASFTVTKLRWLAEHEPDHAARVARVMLPHDWLTWRLNASGAGAAEPATDRGDASGTGYFSPASGRWLPEVAAAALGHEPGLPRIAKPSEVVGETAGGAVLAPGTGDNMGAALGLSLEPGELAL